MGGGLTSWADVINLSELGGQTSQKAFLLANLNASRFTSLGSLHTAPTTIKALLKRLLELCPCLYSQINTTISSRGVVHLCETTLGSRIVSKNAWLAYEIQHPKISSKPFLYPPLLHGAGVGDIMEALCSEVLTNEGLPELKYDGNGWPIWDKLGHICLNKNK
ncbi:MAG: hypothetical protein ABIN74_00485, partial [Ferruginibacter sp.]